MQEKHMYMQEKNLLSGELVLSAFDQNNLRRGYDCKC